MITVVIGCLTVLAVYLGTRWHVTTTENVQLRAQVASLKRQLANRGR